MKKSIYISCILLCIASSCTDLSNQKTRIEIEDNERHYSPVRFEQELEIVYKIKNTGSAPLVIDEVFTSCSCITVENSSTKMIPEGQEGFIFLSYTANSTVGYAKHFISLYGNFEDSDCQELIFDIHIVPPHLYTKDYEDVFREENLKNGAVKKLVDGDETSKGYYVDE
ncbi:DUF1573 domain-containing protein [Flavobacterium sp. JP2137]|uniref:DUF1573 domain-containing protein n=1 Tax=Flavobacterium sp. JP2137 TaxID=3414510 RepID=UPI003D2FA0A8